MELRMSKPQGGVLFSEANKHGAQNLRWSSISRNTALAACVLVIAHSRQENAPPSTAAGGTLIITSRSRLDEWAAALNQNTNLSMHMYTEPLSKRLECSWK